MSVLRNDLQVALNDLHVALMQSADHYRYAAELVANELACQLFETIADSRDLLAKEAEEAIRDSGDLPSVPDVYRETGEQLLQRLEAVFSTHEVAIDIIQHFITVNIRVIVRCRYRLGMIVVESWHE